MNANNRTNSSSRVAGRIRTGRLVLLLAILAVALLNASCALLMPTAAY